MMTPQDIREKGFEKAVFGGYDAASVDNFLEAVSADFAAVCKENSILRSKMKILVDKIEEYRATEDAMRLALLSAQKIGEQIQNEAKANSEKMLRESQEQADSIIGNVMRDLKIEEQKLIEAKRSSAQFIENMRFLCVKELDFLEALGEKKIAEDTPEKPPAGRPENPQLRVVQEQPETVEEKIDDAVRKIEDSVLSSAGADEPEINIEGDSEEDSGDREATQLYDFSSKEGKAPARTQFSFETLTFNEVKEPE